MSGAEFAAVLVVFGGVALAAMIVGLRGSRRRRRRRKRRRRGGWVDLRGPWE